MRRAVAILLLVLAGCGDDDPAGTDAASSDAALPDAALPDASPDASLDFPDWLSQAGLFSDPASHTVTPRALLFTPTYALWSDAASKRRWLLLPEGGQIDSSDPDHWRLPVGTRLFKEFSRGGVLLETRLILRTGPGPMDYRMGAYIWLPDGSDARFTPAGASNVNGTTHDVPSADTCWSCHVGEPGRALGLSAVQLSHATPPSVASLQAAGLLTTPVPTWTVPGDAVVSAALGSLHANCGHCHSDTGSARPDVDQILRLSLAETTPAATAIYRTTVGVAPTRFMRAGLTARVAPGAPAASAVLYRMQQRGDTAQMPPLATEVVDASGIAAVTAWIQSLPPP